MKNKLNKLKELYSEGKNIIDFIKNQSNETTNTTEAIMISYDMQAGSYIKFASENEEYLQNYTNSIAKTINSLGNFDSIIEVGIGEATTFANTITKLKNTPKNRFGFDISWSRIKFANQYLNSKKVNDNMLFTGDLFNIPLCDNSIDIVYTSHSIEPNGGREIEALTELFRITKKYLILIEPAYELASNEGKERMERLGYVKNLPNLIKKLGLNIVEYRLFDHFINPLNPTGLIVIKKEEITSEKEHNFYACPITKLPLELINGSFYCKESLLVYPIINNIPCLLPDNAIVASHFLT